MTALRLLLAVSLTTVHIIQLKLRSRLPSDRKSGQYTALLPVQMVVALMNSNVLSVRELEHRILVALPIVQGVVITLLVLQFNLWCSALTLGIFVVIALIVGRCATTAVHAASQSDTADAAILLSCLALPSAVRADFVDAIASLAQATSMRRVLLQWVILVALVIAIGPLTVGSILTNRRDTQNTIVD